MLKKYIYNAKHLMIIIKWKKMKKTRACIFILK